MRKLSIFAAGFMAATIVLLSTGVAMADPPKEEFDAKNQVILRLLAQPTAAAIEEYYGAQKQYWRQEILSVQKVTESPYYEVVIRVETFHGAHNPPYGLETMIFYIGPFDQIQLVHFDHQSEGDSN